MILGGGGSGNMWKIPTGSFIRVAKPTNRCHQFSSSNSSKSTTPSSSFIASPKRRNDTGYASLSSEDSQANDGLASHANSGFPINSWSAAFAASGCGDEDYEMVSVDENHGVFEDHVFGLVPSVDEVQHVVSALEKVFDSSACTSSQIREKLSLIPSKEIAYAISSPTASESDWIEPMDTSLINNSGGVLQKYGPNSVYDAFHLFQTDSTVQRMVVSISSDKDVWNSILENEAVKELRKSYYTGEDGNVSSDGSTEDSDEESSEVTNIVKWIFDNTVDLFEKIACFVSELFKLSGESSSKQDGGEQFEYKLRTSFMLSVFVLLVVVVARAKIA